MDILFRLIEWLVQSLLNEPTRRDAQAGQSQARAAVSPPAARSTGLPPSAASWGQVRPPASRSQPPSRTSPAASQPLAPRTQASKMGPVYDDGGWRLALTVLALIALFAIIAAWILQTQVSP